MKPKLKGNYAELYAQKATLFRRTTNGTFVEFVVKHEATIRYSQDGTSFADYTSPWYSVSAYGMNLNGVPCHGVLRDYESDKGNYFWQYAEKRKVLQIIENPEKAYNYNEL